jgi:hypothetical protein
MLLLGSAIGPFQGETVVKGFGYEALAVAAACLAVGAVYCIGRLPSAGDAVRPGQKDPS